MRVRTSLKAGGFIISRNHNRRGIKVRSSVRAGGIDPGGNHNRNFLR